MEVFNNFVRLKFVTAEPENILTKLSNANIELIDVHLCDPLTVEIKIRKGHLLDTKSILRNAGVKLSVIGREGILWGIIKLFERPVIVGGMILFLLLSVIVPNRIFFVKVSGNTTLSARYIASQAEEYGVRFGAKSSDIRSEEVKNHLLSSIPELQWAGITTSGSTAIIHVTERSVQEKMILPRNTVSSIVAARDGIITKITVEKGTQLFSVGQTVKEGNVIVSGYTDCGIKMVAENADAEVFAHTLRENRFISPVCSAKRGSLEEEKTCYRIRIGKKVINFCNHSGISDDSCVKMYLENYWTLPGGFHLPVSVTKIKHLNFEQLCVEERDETTYQWLAQFARSYLQQNMIAGTILTEQLQWEQLDDACILTGAYACNEMIGQVKYEEIMKQNAEDN